MNYNYTSQNIEIVLTGGYHNGILIIVLSKLTWYLYDYERIQQASLYSQEESKQ